MPELQIKPPVAYRRLPSATLFAKSGEAPESRSELHDKMAPSDYQTASGSEWRSSRQPTAMVGSPSLCVTHGQLGKAQGCSRYSRMALATRSRTQRLVASGCLPTGTRPKRFAFIGSRTVASMCLRNARCEGDKGPGRNTRYARSCRRWSPCSVRNSLRRRYGPLCQ
jgi:hypothetical protein